MKPVASLGAVLLCLAPHTSLHAQAGDLQSLSWLAGCWLDAAQPGSGEMWMAPAGGTLLGVGRTVRAGATREFEFMQIRADADGRLVFIAQPSGQARTEFKLLSHSAQEVVFENLQHDFPQRVAYRLDTLETPAVLKPRIEGQRNGTARVLEFPALRRSACGATPTPAK